MPVPHAAQLERDSGLDVSAPKHGKEDPNNDPHVGGNTWAGGTGGRDTGTLMDSRMVTIVSCLPPQCAFSERDRLTALLPLVLGSL